MGVGKTLPAIRASVGGTIILCPATVKANWRREILREKPNARILVVSGTVPSPIEPDVDFVILNYDIAPAWRESLIAWRPDTCICDEAHVCRNTYNTISSDIADRLDCRSPLYFDRDANRQLSPRSCRAHNFSRRIEKRFRQLACFRQPLLRRASNTMVFRYAGASNLDELHQKLYAEKIMMRRMKHEVLTLPQKTRSIIRITIDPADLTQYQKWEQALAAEIAANPSLLRDTSFQCLSRPSCCWLV